jgi:hypothetical protein
MHYGCICCTLTEIPEIRMDERISKINIKPDVPENTIDYFRLQEQWENEGGAISIRLKEDLIPGDKIPFTPGESFKVIHATIDLIDDHFFYIVDIQHISEETNKKN